MTDPTLPPLVSDRIGNYAELKGRHDVASRVYIIGWKPSWHEKSWQHAGGVLSAVDGQMSVAAVGENWPAGKGHPIDG